MQMDIEKIRSKPIDDLLRGTNEQPGSQFAYAIDRELQRRQEHRAESLVALQKEAAESQIKSSDSIVRNAKWIRASALSVIIGTIIAVASFVLSLV